LDRRDLSVLWCSPSALEGFQVLYRAPVVETRMPPLPVVVVDPCLDHTGEVREVLGIQEQRSVLDLESAVEALHARIVARGVERGLGYALPDRPAARELRGVVDDRHKPRFLPAPGEDELGEIGIKHVERLGLARELRNQVDPLTRCRDHFSYPARLRPLRAT